ncbi:type VI secretion system protein [Variovorax saccharolyticus]|uniref:type VI secretion system protein n=1 Tax=Variovorax saccharolyticus TaxID=3053516 RepID=UPI002578785A|nr:type VI secretion system protein [Variovorax sp. J22R187]MDM0019676.1 type VI secretion system protein [Variovorax sp. J22R187]
MNAELPLPPHFWSLLALCLLALLALWWFLLASGRTGRRRRLRQRIAALDAQAAPPAPLDLIGMQEAMARARRAAQHAPAPQALRHSLYAIPWFMFLGDAPARLPGLLGGAGAAAPVPGSDDSFWRWHFLHSTIAIEIGPAALGDAADPRERGRWHRALLELAERRERLPLNGIVACVAAATMLGEAGAAEALATRLRQRVDEVAEQLRVQLPVYLVVTGLEQLEGYAAMRDALPADALEQALGHRLADHGPAALDAGARLDDIFGLLAAQLHAVRMALLRDQQDPSRRRAIHVFIEQLRALQPGLRVVALRLFAAPRGPRAPRWRGLYLTAAPSATVGGAFIDDLFERFLPADQPLAS